MELCWKAVSKVDIRVLQISEQLVNMLFMLLQKNLLMFFPDTKEKKTANPRNGMVGRGRIQSWSSCLEGRATGEDELFQ